MRRMLVAGIAAFAGLAGWASPAGAGSLSTTGPVIAILAGDLFLGEAEGNFDGSGAIRIQSRAKPDVTCRGQFTYSTELGDAGNLRCSDGVIATFQFQRLSLVGGVNGWIKSISGKNRQVDSGLRSRESGARPFSLHVRSDTKRFTRLPIDAASAGCTLPAASVMPPA